MSYIFLAVTGEESSADCFAGMFRSAPWKSTSDAGKLYFNAKETGFCHGSPFGTKLEPLKESLGGESFKSCPQDFPAPTFLPPEQTVSMADKMALLVKVRDCGMRFRESLQRFNLSLCLLKIPQIYELRDLSPSSKLLTAWGMTHAGVCLDVAISAQTISEPECSLLPTPTSHNSKEGAYPAEGTRNTPTLAFQIGGKINPDWNEWRMGCPIKWSDLKPLEIDKFQQWLSSHGKHFQTPELRKALR